MNAKIFWVFFCMLLLVVSLNARFRTFDTDEFEAIHSAWKIYQGERIYVDFFQQHHPFLYYLLVPLIAVFGETQDAIVAMRVASLYIFFAMLGITYGIAFRVFSREVALTTLLLLTTMPLFVDKAIEIRPDTPQVLFGLLSVLFLFIYDKNKSAKYLILSAAALGVSFLFLQKAVFLALPLGIFLFFRNDLSLRLLTLYGMTFFAVLAPYYAHLLYHHAFSGYLTFGWLVNMKFLEHFTPFTFLRYSLALNSLLWIFYGAGLLFAFFQKPLRQKQVAFLSMALLGSVYLVRAPYPQYFMMALPFVAMVAADSLVRLSRNIPSGVFLALVPLIIATFPLPLFFLVVGGIMNNRIQLDRVDYVTSLTAPQDFVYDGNLSFNLFRRDIDFFWFSLNKGHALKTYQTMTGYHYDIYEAIERFKPKVISTYDIKNLNDERIALHYEPSPAYRDLLIRTTR